MSENQKRVLEQQLWNIANTLRGKMNADEFRDYILGFIFYKYLAEKMDLYANSILQQDAIKYHEIDETTEEGKEYLDAVQEEALEKLGYFLKPSELFSEIARRGNQNGSEESGSNFILEELQKILTNIQLSTMGTESEEDFDNLFEDMDLNSSKLGKTPEARNELISKILVHLDKIDFKLEDTDLDILGDAYEYLISEFASGAGRKAGEFYTPQQVSKVLAKIVTTGKDRLRSVYDPTCGSGSLLLRVAKEVKEVSNFYGQERNPTTYNLARMNMILHDVHYRKFDIKNEDTLEYPQHIDLQFEAIVANPPFSAQWSASPLFLSDDRFSQYGKLAPSDKADLAFVQHVIYHLAENGIAAIVLPHGILFRQSTEYHIRRFLIEEKNYIDAVIGLPLNIFYGTEMPACIVVFKKCRENPSDILFIDASKEFGTFKTKNSLRPQDVDKIVSSYQNRGALNNYSKVVDISFIKNNDYNLSFSQYFDSFEAEFNVDITDVIEQLNYKTSLLDAIDVEIAGYANVLGIACPNGFNLPLLKKYKLWVTYGLFNQKTRFKKNNDESYPDWGLKTLKDVFRRKTEKNIGGGVLEVLTNSATKGVIKQDDYFEKKIANPENLQGYYLVNIDDFIYNPRISITAPVGPLKRNKIVFGIVSPLYTVLELKEGNPDFFELYFETNLWHGHMKSVANYGARHDRMNITKANFEMLPLPFPDIEEQQKIAEFVASIQRKIDLISEL